MIRHLGKIILVRIYRRFLIDSKESDLDVKRTHKVLVVCCIGIGNSILSIPLIREIEKIYGREKIDVLVNDPASQAILRRLKIGHRIVLYKGGILKRLNILCQLKREKYFLSILTFPSLSLVPEMIPFFIRSRYAITHDYSDFQEYFHLFGDAYSHRISVDLKLHDIEQNTNLIKPIQRDRQISGNYPDYRLSREENESVKEFRAQHSIGHRDRLILVHPGSKKKNDHKRWPLENFLELNSRLTDAETNKVFFLIGPDERDFYQEIKNLGIHCLFNMPIPKLMPIMKSADLFISNDSGMMHLASITGVPVIALWGATDPMRNSARGRQVINIFNKKQACRPCIRIIRSGECIHDFHCIRSLSPERVYRAAGRVINRSNRKTPPNAS
jgi:heptosyltransferase-2